MEKVLRFLDDQRNNVELLLEKANGSVNYHTEELQKVTERREDLEKALVELKSAIRILSAPPGPAPMAKRDPLEGLPTETRSQSVISRCNCNCKNNKY